ncbi:Hypp4677 [Branchiostoma lanceolatum]|uniref:Hypp4677 protein n=1 Tax=Branchiostoma lanceolatum TaxID=7740 RepID=A0A8K0ACQ5_BRALA|nr:Hypp4677 [Branchiostoma lanceolatum]
MPAVAPTCPEGMAYEGDPIHDCMPCDLCTKFPNTGICSTQKCIDFLRKSVTDNVTDALQLSAQEEITDKPPTEQAVWTWPVVAACLALSVALVVGAVVTVVILRRKKQRDEVILGNRKKKRDAQPVPLPDVTVEKLNFPVENTEPPSSDTLDLQQTLSSLDNVALSGDED